MVALDGALEGFRVSSLDSTAGRESGPVQSMFSAMGSAGTGGGDVSGGMPSSRRLRTMCCSLEFHRFFTSLSVRYTPNLAVSSAEMSDHLLLSFCCM